MKDTITELKNIIKVFNSRLDKAEERISELKNRAVELMQSEHQKGNRMKSKIL